MEKKIPVKNIYLFLIISIGLVVLGISSTYAVFTAEAEITDPIVFSSSLTSDQMIVETAYVTVPANSSKTVTLNINNDTTGSLNYACWFTESENITGYIAPESVDTPSGVIEPAGSKTISLNIVNMSSRSITNTVGISSNGDNVVLDSSMIGITDYTPAYKTIQKLGLAINTTQTPDFSNVSGASGTQYENGVESTVTGDGTLGIFESQDDLGTSYYFRGAVTNNYVSFAGYTWRIVRINGDGTIRMVYINDELESEYNDNYVFANLCEDYDLCDDASSDNGYLGYMHGTFDEPHDCTITNNIISCRGGSQSYENATSNDVDSTIKSFLDDWYMDNLSSYSGSIADAIYCNDRSITPVNEFVHSGNAYNLTGGGYGAQNTAYAAYTRNVVEHKPSLKCPNMNDRFTMNTSIGNGDLTYPIALLTADEVIMAGANAYNAATKGYIKNDTFYLYNMYSFTMTPMYYNYYYNSGWVDGSMFLLLSTFVTPNGPWEAMGVHPVISLKPTAITNGTGSSGTPFTVG